MNTFKEFTASNNTVSEIGIIDEEDFHLVKNGVWLDRDGYAQINSSKRIHRLVVEKMIGKPIPKGNVVDHKNRNRLDNRRSNLRLCTVKDNNRNVSKVKGSSRYKGVYWKSNRNKWSSQIKVEGKLIYLGLFENENDAAIKYNEAAKIHHKEFASLNVI